MSKLTREFVIENGPFDATENARIFDKWFSGTRPRDRLLSYLDERFGFLGDGILADVGCGYGMVLAVAAKGSYGVDYEGYQTVFAKALGFHVENRDVVEDDLSDLPKVQTVWCAAVIEHLDSPHILLRKIHQLLKPGGRLILETPSAIPALWRRRIPGMERVFGDHDDHVNSFTPSTIVRFCERAGFSEEAVVRYSTPLINRGVPVGLCGWFPFSLVAQSLVYVGRAIDGWEYPAKSQRRVSTSAKGYSYESTWDDPAQARRK